MGFTWTKVVANFAVSSCLAFSSLLTTQGYSGYFLLHFPSSCLDLPLASTLLCEARTFLKLSIIPNLRPSDQADTIIITSKNNLSIPIFKFFLEFDTNVYKPFYNYKLMSDCLILYKIYQKVFFFRVILSNPILKYHYKSNVKKLFSVFISDFYKFICIYAPQFCHEFCSIKYIFWLISLASIWFRCQIWRICLKKHAL